MDEAFRGLVILGGMFALMIWELVWGLPGCVRDLIAPPEEEG
jgi:hypothetical protein